MTNGLKKGVEKFCEKKVKKAKKVREVIGWK